MAQSIFMYLFFFFLTVMKTHKKIFKSLSDNFGDKGNNKIIFKNFINVISLNAGHCRTELEKPRGMASEMMSDNSAPI